MTATMLERDFQTMIVQQAQVMGWKVHHARPGMSSKGRWLTHVQGHAGFPDLVLAHDGRPARRDQPAMLPCVIFAELKTSTGKLRDGQADWQRVLTCVPGIEYYLWRPRDIPAITRRLAGYAWQN